MNKSALVRESSLLIASKSIHVTINEKLLSNLANEFLTVPFSYSSFESFSCHLSPSKYSLAIIIDYIFVLDSLNFCFWPSDWEYENLALALKKLIENDIDALKPKNIQKWDLNFVKTNIFNGDFPLINERFRILQEISFITLNYFDGEFENIYKKASNSAVQLVFLLTSYFNNFQDLSIYKGHQVCFYKRSQILVADLWGALKDLPDSKNLFPDIDQITTFPDYRVPQILNQLNILEYSNELKYIIKEKKIIESGSEMEIEIRGFTVLVVEKLKEELGKKGIKANSVEIDWFLWQKGEIEKDNIVNHHRTLTIYY